MTREQDLADRVEELERIVDDLVEHTGASTDKTQRGRIDPPGQD